VRVTLYPVTTRGLRQLIKDTWTADEFDDEHGRRLAIVAAVAGDGNWGIDGDVSLGSSGIQQLILPDQRVRLSTCACERRMPQWLVGALTGTEADAPGSLAGVPLHIQVSPDRCAESRGLQPRFLARR
jgi:hypothetical protein